MKQRTSLIWLESIENFQKRVDNCESIADIIRSFGFALNSANYRRIYERIKIDSIDIRHIPLGLAANKGRAKMVSRVSIEKHLVMGSTIKTHSLKLRLIRDGYLLNQCAICGLGPEWNNKLISLHLDHINGIRNDNRLENLRILCPNCHSQTDTYSGKHNGIKCMDCGSKISSKSERCQKCANVYFGQFQLKKFNITKETLEKLIWEKPTTHIAFDFGVSDKTVEKRCRQLGIIKPPRGYWTKRKNSQQNP